MERLQAKLGYTFKHPKLLNQALTHSSYAYETGGGAADCNERLEFLGDAVLEVTVSVFLFRNFPALSEGELTKRRASLVCEASLSNAARDCGLGPLLKLGRGEDISGGRERDSLLSDALEAVFGAVYLDGGMENANAVILGLLSPSADGNAAIKDYKTQLQEVLQKDTNDTAEYEIIHEEGPPHLKTFTARVTHQKRELGTGTGRSKKEAEQNAAKKALAALKGKGR